MGGPIAQLLWQRHPDAVRGLVLCATAARFASRRDLNGPFGALGFGMAMALSGVPGQLRQQGFSRLVRNRTADLGLAHGPWRNGSATIRPPWCTRAWPSAGLTRPAWIGSIDVPTAVVITTLDATVSPRPPIADGGVHPRGRMLFRSRRPPGLRGAGLGIHAGLTGRLPGGDAIPRGSTGAGAHLGASRLRRWWPRRCAPRLVTAAACRADPARGSSARSVPTPTRRPRPARRHTGALTEATPRSRSSTLWAQPGPAPATSPAASPHAHASTLAAEPRSIGRAAPTATMVRRLWGDSSETRQTRVSPAADVQLGALAGLVAQGGQDRGGHVDQYRLVAARWRARPKRTRPGPSTKRPPSSRPTRRWRSRAEARRWAVARGSDVAQASSPRVSGPRLERAQDAHGLVQHSDTAYTLSHQSRLYLRM